MSIWIEHWDTKTDGELNEHNMRAKLEARGYRVSRYVYDPGTCFPKHTHGTDKIDGVLSGRFKLSMLGQQVILEARDCLAVPAGMAHSAEVIGSEAVVSLDAENSPVLHQPLFLSAIFSISIVFLSRFRQPGLLRPSGRYYR